MLVHEAVAQRHVVVVTSRGGGGHNERALVCGNVEDGGVDVGSELLTCSRAQTTLLESVTEFQRGHGPRHSLAVAQGGGHRKLGHVLIRTSDGRTSGRVDGLSDVGHRTPDGVACALHHCGVGAVNAHVAGKDQGIVEAFEEVLKGNALFLGKRVSHCLSSLGFVCLELFLVAHDLGIVPGLLRFSSQPFKG